MNELNLLIEQQGHILLITFNRIEKHNAFDDVLLADLQIALDAAQNDAEIRVIVLKSNGRHFSAGADVNWMKRMAQFSEQENREDAQVLARLMFTLNQCSKPTIAMVQGSAFGGGAGLVAACDIAIAGQSARFCFSEVTLGLIPAVISPYVIKAIGERAARWLFMSAEVFDAQRAYELQLIQHCVTDEELLSYTINYAQSIAQLPPNAVCDAKSLVHQVAGCPIDEALQTKTAALIAKKRVSVEGQRALQAFLNKEIIPW
ncbi:MAG: enoyl-CoA hydratase-related protein [Legionellaceae bacterium]|nr:enoyl-CoA hydratase-related protein [Legionellaceae bacterium]